METPVLIVIDMLRDFLSSWKPDRTDSLVQSINEQVAVMRSFSRPVLWVRQEFEPDLRDALPEMKAKGIRITIKGTPGSEFSRNWRSRRRILLSSRNATARSSGPPSTKHWPAQTGCHHSGRDQYPCLHSHHRDRRIPARLARDPGDRLYRLVRPGTPRNLSTLHEGQTCRAPQQ